MIDKAAFIGMNSAQDSMRKLEIITNNLANLNTTGFRADYEVVKPYTLDENGTDTRIYSSLDSTYTDFTPGSVLNTGRDLDVSIVGNGFIAVQSKTGKPAFTRDGSLQISKGGFLETKSGELVMGIGGLISVPSNAQKIEISKDGTISALLEDGIEMVTINKIRLVNPPISNLKKGKDGLIYTRDESDVKPDQTVKILTGSLEGSNVNAIDTLTQLIDLSRHYEMHTNLMKEMSDNASIANQLLQVPR